MKVNLSSAKGLRVFFKKGQSHSALLNKKVQAELKKVEGELVAEQKKLDELEGELLDGEGETAAEDSRAWGGEISESAQRASQAGSRVEMMVH